VRGSTGFGRAYEAADDREKRGDALKDVESVARWVTTQRWADKNRLVAAGASYGGYLVLFALARWPELWRAGVDLKGVVDLNTVLETTTGLIRTILIAEFGDPVADRELLARFSPIKELHRIVDPVFVYHGSNDTAVSRSQSDLIVRSLRKRGVACEHMVAEGEGHGTMRTETRVEQLARVAQFLETHAR
jgi:dipeptidyl aminopeptidase/acylaminoacyl peptidase